MSKAETIRELGRQSVPTKEIARRLNIPYQHAYGTLRAAGLLAAKPTEGASTVAKPPLTVQLLSNGGFQLHGLWTRGDADKITLKEQLPARSGVYAFVSEGRALYVGVAKSSVRQRLYFYGNPGASQRTNARIKGLIIAHLERRLSISVYLAHPADFEWNGLPVSGCAGLEIGLISQFSLEWNVQGSIR